ncbi:hypothetical protein PS15m_004830 [Mucor circinelloides]
MSKCIVLKALTLSNVFHSRNIDILSADDERLPEATNVFPFCFCFNFFYEISEFEGHFSTKHEEKDDEDTTTVPDDARIPSLEHPKAMKDATSDS